MQISRVYFSPPFRSGFSSELTEDVRRIFFGSQKVKICVIFAFLGAKIIIFSVFILHLVR